MSYGPGMKGERETYVCGTFFKGIFALCVWPHKVLSSSIAIRITTTVH
jgi:hypothetical protein